MAFTGAAAVALSCRFQNSGIIFNFMVNWTLFCPISLDFSKFREFTKVYSDLTNFLSNFKLLRIEILEISVLSVPLIEIT